MSFPWPRCWICLRRAPIFGGCLYFGTLLHILWDWLCGRASAWACEKCANRYLDHDSPRDRPHPRDLAPKPRK